MLCRKDLEVQLQALGQKQLVFPFKNSFCFVEMRMLAGTSFTNIFSHSVGSFHFLLRSLDPKRILKLRKPM